MTPVDYRFSATTMSNPKSKLVSDLVVVIVFATCGGITFALLTAGKKAWICDWTSQLIHNGFCMVVIAGVKSTVHDSANRLSISLIDRLIALFALVSSPSLRPLALQILVEKRITGFPVVDADWNLP
ncbi:hypothetical protein L1987_81017 [Smallanthus sonchifolius]|uniref:Uncharacterized protein n=1 Tax=Smallanthus sonchifolius TaxID=185202 RepID=A0ACB8YNM3_9ASTR|nr:hypothetical protein L1987_81017 [Smallanthus sonchifolius]